MKPQSDEKRRANKNAREEQPVEEFSPTCQACRFWESIDEGEGLCRRHAPPCEITMAPTVYADEEPQALWPKTSRWDWCGQFSPDHPGCWGPGPSSLAGTPAATPAEQSGARTPERTPDCAAVADGSQEAGQGTEGVKRPLRRSRKAQQST